MSDVKEYSAMMPVFGLIKLRLERCGDFIAITVGTPFNKSLSISRDVVKKHLNDFLSWLG